MTLENEIKFHGIPHQPDIEALIQERIDKLSHFYDRVQGCRVVLEPHNAVKVVVSVPHHDPIVITHETTADPNAALDVIVRDTFTHAERRLRDLHDRRVDARR